MSLSCTVSEISLISQNLKRSRDPKHIPFGSDLSFVHYVCMYVCMYLICQMQSTPLSISTRYLKCLVSPIWLGAKFKKTGHVTLTTPTRGSRSSQGLHLTYSTCIQHLATLASAVTEIWLRASKLKMGHVTLTTPF